MDERATIIREGQYKHTSRPTPSPVCSSPSSFSCIVLFFAYIFHFAGFIEIIFLDRGGDEFLFGLVFP